MSYLPLRHAKRHHRRKITFQIMQHTDYDDDWLRFHLHFPLNSHQQHYCLAKPKAVRENISRLDIVLLSSNFVHMKFEFKAFRFAFIIIDYLHLFYECHSLHASKPSSCDSQLSIRCTISIITFVQNFTPDILMMTPCLHSAINMNLDLDLIYATVFFVFSRHVLSVTTLS